MLKGVVDAYYLKRIETLYYAGEKYGKARMKEALIKYAGESAEYICRQMLWETRRFVGLNRRTDDTTMVAVKVL